MAPVNSSGYRHSLDPILLADFAAAEKGSSIADLGTGAGILPLLLAQSTSASRIVGIEIQDGLAARARQAVAAAGHEQRIAIVQTDLRACRSLFSPESFDAVISNPPFRQPGRGRIASDVERAAARHEMHGTLADFIAAARYLLKQGGRCYMVYLPERLAELLGLLREARLEPKRLRCVHGKVGGAATMVLVEARRNGRPGLMVEAPLFVFDGPEYTLEAAAILGQPGASATG